jgi:hypothetical protein
MSLSLPRLLRVLAPAAAAALVFGVAPAAPAAVPTADRPLTTALSPPPIRHVFVINLENEGFKSTFRLNSPAPYLAHTLRAKGMLLDFYYATAHNSLPNYIAQISGQGPNADTQADCQTFSDFQGTGTVAPGQAVGQGCVYPASVRTLPEQLDAKGFTWAGYMEDMAHSPAPNTCRHPALNSKDDTQTAEPGDQYAVRHNPFMYFHSIIDRQDYCDRHVLPLKRLPVALGSVATTPNFSYITPNLCHDGHDEPCVTGEPGGLVTADKWLQQWVPKILNSPAFKQDGLLVVTFDEAEAFSRTGDQDASACCNESPGPNSPMPGIFGPGGGRVGAVLVSPYIRPGSFNDTPYNHYGLLCSIENIYGLSHLGYAATTERCFGSDVYNKGV